MSKEITRVLFINISLIALVTLYYGITSTSSSAFTAGTSGGMFSFFLVPLNLILSLGHFINRKNESGKAFLLATALCLLIGYSLCSAFPLVIHERPIQ